MYCNPNLGDLFLEKYLSGLPLINEFDLDLELEESTTD